MEEKEGTGKGKGRGRGKDSDKSVPLGGGFSSGSPSLVPHGGDTDSRPLGGGMGELQRHRSLGVDNRKFVPAIPKARVAITTPIDPVASTAAVETNRSAIVDRSAQPKSTGNILFC
jgi:hypothetical protein